METTPSKLQALRDLLATPETAELGPGPRPGVQSLVELNPHLDQLLSPTPLPLVRQELMRCAILLWHDHHEVAHEICQQIETPDGSWLHGILHRREPDYGNARYWFHRVGRHPGFSMLADHVNFFLAVSEREQQPEKFLQPPMGELFHPVAARLVPQGQWDPFAFVAACEEAAGRSGSAAQRECLRQIQKLEFEVLLEYFWNDRITSE